MAIPWNDRLLNDDHTPIPIVRPQSYGYAQADPNRKSHKAKHPVGFVPNAKRPTTGKPK